MRELRNVIERACILTDGDFITERELAISMPRDRCRGSRVPVVGVAGVRDAARREPICSSTSNASTSSARWCGLAATRRRPRRCSASAAARSTGVSSGSDLSSTISRRRDAALMEASSRTGPGAASARVRACGSRLPAHIRIRDRLRSLARGMAVPFTAIFHESRAPGFVPVDFSIPSRYHPAVRPLRSASICRSSPSSVWRSTRSS